MVIHELIWPDDRVEHIARHGVAPEEVEDVCFGRPFVRRTKSEGENPVYLVQGQTRQGRYLSCVIVRFPDHVGFPIPARDMTPKEKSKFRNRVRK